MPTTPPVTTAKDTPLMDSFHGGSLLGLPNRRR